MVLVIADFVNVQFPADVVVTTCLGSRTPPTLFDTSKVSIAMV